MEKSSDRVCSENTEKRQFVETQFGTVEVKRNRQGFYTAKFFGMTTSTYEDPAQAVKIALGSLSCLVIKDAMAKTKELCH